MKDFEKRKIHIMMSDPYYLEVMKMNPMVYVFADALKRLQESDSIIRYFEKLDQFEYSSFLLTKGVLSKKEIAIAQDNYVKQIMSGSYPKPVLPERKLDNYTDNQTHEQSTNQIPLAEEDDPLAFLDEDNVIELDVLLHTEEFRQLVNEVVDTYGYAKNNEFLYDYHVNDNPEALKQLIDANKNLVYKIAKYYGGKSTTGNDLSDMEQDGMIGLMKAIEKFDLDKGYQFSTYATHWIRQQITRGICDKSSTVRIPVHMHEMINKINKAQSESDRVFGFTNDDWIINQLCITQEQYLNAIRVRNTFLHNVSLDAPVGVDGDTTLGDFCVDNKPSVEDNIISIELRNNLLEVLETLTDREKQVLELRFGLKDGKSRTLEEVGKEFYVTRERIRQIEAKALRKLKHPSRVRKLLAYKEE